tara:strand:+ start:202 stop:321 length:120 start_codon:yes stop_codon:yes gene_type:complete
VLLVTADDLGSHAINNVANHAQAKQNLTLTPQQLEESEI